MFFEADSTCTRERERERERESQCQTRYAAGVGRWTLGAYLSHGLSTVRSNVVALQVELGDCDRRPQCRAQRAATEISNVGEANQDLRERLVDLDDLRACHYSLESDLATGTQRGHEWITQERHQGWIRCFVCNCKMP